MTYDPAEMIDPSLLARIEQLGKASELPEELWRPIHTKASEKAPAKELIEALFAIDRLSIPYFNEHQYKP